MKKVGVLLSGCGFLDGAEIREAVLTLLALDKLGKGIEVVVMAPDEKQHHVVNHNTQTPIEGSRNILEESARIARGKIKSLTAVKSEELDALLIPGGYGVAKNLCSFAFKGANGEVLPEVRSLLEKMYAKQAPMGAICIAPALMALVLGHKGIALTIGEDAETAAEIQKTGAQHVVCPVDQICVDEAHKIVSTPAYMYDQANLYDISQGIEKCVGQVLSWIK